MRLRRGQGFVEVLLAVLLAAVLFGGCAPAATPTPIPTATSTPSATPTITPTLTPTPTPTPQPLAIILWHNLPDRETVQLEQEIGRFQDSNLKVRIIPRQYGDEAALEKIAAESDAQFDIVLGNARAIGFLRDNRQIQPLDPLFDDSFFQGLARPGIEGVTAGRHIWGVPHTLGMQLLLFYNTALVTEPPADTGSMIEIATKLTDAEHSGLGMNGLDPLWLIPWLSAYGGWPVDDQGQLTLNTTAMIDALSFMHSLAQQPDVMRVVDDYNAGLEAFKAGQTAMWIDGEWSLQVLGENDDLKLGAALLPILADTGLEPACLVAGRYFAVGSQLEGERLEATQLFIAQMVGTDGATRWTETFHTMPSSLAVLESDTIQQDPFLRLSASQMLAGRGAGLTNGMQMAMELMRGPLEDVLYNRISPREAARGMQARADALTSP